MSDEVRRSEHAMRQLLAQHSADRKKQYAQEAAERQRQEEAEERRQEMMEEFASETDSEYTSYWRDWVSYHSSCIQIFCKFAITGIHFFGLFWTSRESLYTTLQYCGTAMALLVRLYSRRESPVDRPQDLYTLSIHQPSRYLPSGFHIWSPPFISSTPKTVP